MRVMRAFVIVLGLCGLCASQQLCEINPNPAYKDARDALDQLLEALHLPNVYFLYWSSDPLMNDFGGAASTECVYAKGMQKWIVYDPEAIKGDLALHFVLAHELAHHQHNHPLSGQRPTKEQELDADRSAGEWLASEPLNWPKEKILEALKALHLPAEARGTHPGAAERRGAAMEGYDRAHDPTPITGDPGTVSFIGCPDGTKALVNGQSIMKTLGSSALSIRKLGSGSHQIQLIHPGYDLREVSLTVDPVRHVQEPCGLTPQLEADWGFPIDAITTGMMDVCKYHLATSAASAELRFQAEDHPLILHGQLQKDPDVFQSCNFNTTFETNTNGEALLTFVYTEAGGEKIATARVSPNSDGTQLIGRLTDLRTGENASLTLQRGYAARRFSHCGIQTQPRPVADGLSTIRVTVVDPAGATVPGARVFLEKLGAVTQDFVFERLTDIDGVRQETATSGKYHLSVGLPGFGNEVLEDIPVTSNQQLNVRCELHRLMP